VTITRVDGGIEVAGLSASQIGDAACDLQIPLHELTPKQASLEQAFMDMTRDEVEFHAVSGTSVEGSGSRE
jgi:ABC-2 type transport system ATP-binding protein